MTAPGSSARFRVVIVMPVYQDWECASMLCTSLEQMLQRLPSVDAYVLLVDDGSPCGIDGWIQDSHPVSLQVETLRLRANLGHQRAICVGICYVHEHLSCDAVVVMDADGEDRPEDAVRLIELALSRPATAVLAERRKRFAGRVFLVGYNLFRVMHRILTGVPVRVGNFSLIPSVMLSTLVLMPELWSHYAGAVIKSRVRCHFVPIDRGVRLRGRSKMNFISLVMHGVSGIATFAEVVATRILITNVFCVLLLCIVLAVVVGLRIWTNLAVPGWATYTAGLVLVMVFQLMGISFGLVFSLMSDRTRLQVVPIRDYGVYVDQLQNMRESL